MSFLDRQQGMLDGSSATARNYGAAIDQWEEHSNRLEGKLRAATQNAEELAKQRLFAQAQLEGQTAVMLVLKAELERVCPNSPLLHEDGRRTNIARAAMAQFLEQHGYNYDPKTQAVRKVGP